MRTVPTPTGDGDSPTGPRPPGPVLVTRAGGFIGRALTDRLTRLGVEVRGVDVTADPGGGVHAGDVTHPDAWAHLLDGVDTVVHAAAIVSNVVPLASHARGEVEVVVVRPGDVYGPGSRPWVVLPLTYLRAGQAVLPARGRGVCSHVHVDNLVDGLVRAVAVPQAAGHVLHVTDGVATTWGHYLGELGRLVGRQPRCLPTPVAIALASAVGRAERARGRDSELCAASMRLLARTGSYRIDRAREVLGYTSTVDLETGLAGVGRWAAEVGLLDDPPPRTATRRRR